MAAQRAGPYVPPGPTLKAFLASSGFARALIGPAFGGRKICCAQDIHHRARAKEFLQPHWRWLVISPTRDEQDRGAVAAALSVIPGHYKDRRLFMRYTLGEDPTHRIIELLFCGLDDGGDRRRIAASEATAVWLDNARGLPEGVFQDALQIARRSYPPLSTWRGVICSSRVPRSAGHWLLTRSGAGGEGAPDLELFRQPGGRSAEVENLANLQRPFAEGGKGADFSYQRLADSYPPEDIRTDIDGEVGASAAELQQEADRQAVRDHFTRFINVMAPDIVPAQHHQLLIDTLERVAAGTARRVMFFLPPGSAKSTYASFLFPPWFMGKFPQKSIILASHQKELAERFGRRVRNAVSSPQFRDIFGFGLSADSGAAGRWETQRGGEFYAAGVDTGIAGRRADLGIIDDPVKSRADADSPTVRESTWQWYKNDFWPRLKPEAAILLIMTRWHDDDLAGRLMEEQKTGGEQWEIISLPAIAKDNDILGRAPGARLWPEWFTEDMFRQAQLDPRAWSALYQQEPMPESGDFFKREWVRYYDTQPPLDELRTYGASDYAVTDQGGDFTVHIVAGVDSNDDLYLLDLVRKQASPDVWVEDLLDLMETWGTLEWGEEKGQIEKSVGPLITKRSQERKIYHYRRQFGTAGDKAARAQPIRGRMAQGKVYLPRSAPWTAEFVAELLRFPAGRHDDQVDALGLLGRMLSHLVRGSKPAAKAPIRGLESLTMDEIWALAGPGKPYGPRPPPRPGASVRI